VEAGPLRDKWLAPVRRLLARELCRHRRAAGKAL